MTIHKIAFEAMQTYGRSNPHRPLIPIFIVPPTAPKIPASAVLDTGAAVSYLDHAYASDLGITDLTVGGIQTTVTAANGQKDDAWIHPVRIEFFGNPLIIDAAFCPSWPAGKTNLLGMRGFFEQMVAAFDHKNRRFFYLLNPAVHVVTASAQPPPVGQSPAVARV